LCQDSKDLSAFIPPKSRRCKNIIQQNPTQYAIRTYSGVKKATARPLSALNYHKINGTLGANEATILFLEKAQTIFGTAKKGAKNRQGSY